VNTLGRYEVCGRRIYRGHPPGAVFEAKLDPAAEARAIRRGSIRLLERLTADLPPGKYRLPLGWPTIKQGEA
jgi:hypothetical protein